MAPPHEGMEAGPAAVEEPPALDGASAPQDNGDKYKKEDEIIPDTPHAAPTNPRWPQLRLRPRHKRYAMLAASIAMAGALGVLTGAAMTGGVSRPAPVNVVGIEDSKAAQRSIARLSLEVAGLKASLDAANKSAHSQFAKI